MAELRAENGYVVVDLDDGEWSADGCYPAEPRRDILFSVFSAQHLANGLEMLAASCTGRDIPVDRAPSVKVGGALHRGKILVLWRLARWTRELWLTPARALALASETRRAALEAERRLTWTELREPASMVR